MATALLLLLSAVLIVLNGIFVGFEFSLVKADPSKLEAAAQTHPRASLALQQRERVNEYLAAAQFGITTVTLALTAAFEPAVESLVGPLLTSLLDEAAVQAVAIAVSLFVATSIHVTFGELIPKSLALIGPEEFVLSTAAVLEFTRWLTSPVVRFYNGLATTLSRWVTGENPELHSNTVDIEQGVDALHQAGELDPSQRELFDSVLDFPNRTVREVMTPASDVVVLDTRRSWDENMKRISQQLYTRYPVRDDSGLIGYLTIHDLFQYDDLNQLKQQDWDELVRGIIRLPETLTLPAAKKAMAGRPFAAVFDEFNQYVGIVTDEDIDEEIIGDIVDEGEEAPPVIKYDSEGRLWVSGEALLEEVLSELDLPGLEHTDGVDTFGGLLLTQLGRQPEQGDVVDWQGYRWVLEEVDGFRIRWVRMDVS